MFPVLFRFADITIHTYGVMLAAGFLFAILLALREARRVEIDPNRVLDLSFYFLIAGLVGSRLFYVLGHWDDFRSHPIEMIMFWKGGLVFYGGLILAFPVGVWYLRKYRLSFPRFADLIAPSIAIGQTFGRLGCFSAGCCYGAPTEVPWALTFTNENSLAPLGVPLHPAQLYESGATFLIFLALTSMRRSGRYQGKLIWYYLLFYSVARFIIEFFRGDPRGFLIPGYLSTSQAIGIPAFIIALVMLLRKK